MFDKNHKGKIKNDKIYRWRLELSCYSFDIVYRPGVENIVADTFSRVYCAVVDSDSLFKLHCTLCHPGITRLMAFICSRNLAFSVEDVQRVTSSCETCNECKPRFYKPNTTPLIKAAQALNVLTLNGPGAFIK